MTAGAPFRRAHAGDFLHVLDALAIPLIVEGRKVVHRAVPLRINVGVAALAGVGFHEILRGDVDRVLGLRGAGEEFSVGTVTLAVHGVGRHQRIDDAIGACVAPADFAYEPEASGDGKGQDDKGDKSQRLACSGLPQPALRMEPVCQKQERTDDANRNMSVKPVPEMMRRSDFD